MGKLFIVALVLGTAAIPVWAGYLNYNGYCWDESRYLRNDELIQRLVEQKYLDWSYISDVGTAQDINIPIEDFDERVPYESFEEFYSVNPNCCSVRAPGRPHKKPDPWWTFYDPSFWMRVTGHAHASVGHKYLLRARTKSGEIKTAITDGSYWTDACGNEVVPPSDYAPH